MKPNITAENLCDEILGYYKMIYIILGFEDADSIVKEEVEENQEDQDERED